MSGLVCLGVVLIKLCVPASATREPGRVVVAVGYVPVVAFVPAVGPSGQSPPRRDRPARRAPR